MSQISPPLRILLAGSIIFLAAWFLVLKPGGGSETAATPAAPAPAATAAPATDTSATPATSAGKAVQKAVAAKERTEAAQAASGEEASAPAATAQSPAPQAGATAKGESKPGAHPVGLPAPVARAVASRKVLALLFWNRKAADDRLVRKELASIERHHGKVFVSVADVADIARYAPITRGVEVEQSPSVVVVDRNLEGRLLTGFVDRDTIDQAVSDALRAR